ncbi:precorrin-2 dehydrogenase/sirohydrochlorin ferrochelatase family protein [Desulfosoma caldarium]|uniref:precorrin-2 dehydrogenase n=1 Tax=Desulfosoma caldarium TaxID=610254 RepID=A0A3N1UVJ8_9BACT|nr:bifunctional precorrin-2 dehydrogenase/sirohydrochlorin ferrochelatase [Desulfosoma caldarium]ROQ91186.1 precorrin-2 dehydrogenase [Desulfosoma caldarium]
MSRVDAQKHTSPMYPIFLSLEDRVCLVVGGGAVGERKVRKLLEHGAHVRLVARDLTPWLKDAADGKTLLYLGSHYAAHHMDGVDLVFAATNDETLNEHIAADAKLRRVWCNMASSPHLGSCVVPASFRRGPLTIAVATEGLSPAVARRVRQRLEEQFGPEWEPCLRFLGALRRHIQKQSRDSALNQELFRRVADLPLTEWIRRERFSEMIDAVSAVLHDLVPRDRVAWLWEKAWSTSC